MNIDAEIKAIGKRLGQYRGSHNITRRQFCEATGQNFIHWGNIERGISNITLSRLLHVCDVYHIDPGAMMPRLTDDSEQAADPEPLSPQRMIVERRLDKCTDEQLHLLVRIIDAITP